MSILIMLILLSILILVHEAGHFFAARAFGIKVDKFGFGLPVGPTLLEWKCGDVTILVHAFLLGGYVSFPDDEKDCELDKNSPDRFANRKISQRAAVISAGVIANVICAFVLVYFAAAIWGYMPSGNYNVIVNDIVASKGESIWTSGIEKGDKIAEINNSPINSVYSMLTFVKLSKSYDGMISQTDAMRNFAALKELNPALQKDEIIPEGVVVRLPEVVPESTVYLDKMTLKGVKKHDNNQITLSKNVLKLRDTLADSKAKSYYTSNGVFSLYDVALAISDNYHPIYIRVNRNNKIVDLKPITANREGLIGVKLEASEILIPTKNLISVLKVGTKYLWDNTYVMVYGLGQIFTGKIPFRDLHGIVAITKVGGDIITNSGIFSGLLLTAIISMNLAVINILPIPALDGGHLMFLLIEKLRAKPLDEKIVEKIGSVFFFLLIVLMILIVFNDISGLVTKKF